MQCILRSYASLINSLHLPIDLGKAPVLYYIVFQAYFNRVAEFPSRGETEFPSKEKKRSSNWIYVQQTVHAGRRHDLSSHWWRESRGRPAIPNERPEVWKGFEIWRAATRPLSPSPRRNCLLVFTTYTLHLIHLPPSFDVHQADLPALASTLALPSKSNLHGVRTPIVPGRRPSSFPRTPRRLEGSRWCGGLGDGGTHRRKQQRRQAAVQASGEDIRDALSPPAPGAQMALVSALQGDRWHPWGRHGIGEDHAGSNPG